MSISPQSGAPCKICLLVKGWWGGRWGISPQLHRRSLLLIWRQLGPQTPIPPLQTVKLDYNLGASHFRRFRPVFSWSVNISVIQSWRKLWSDESSSLEKEKYGPKKTIMVKHGGGNIMIWDSLSITSLHWGALYPKKSCSFTEDGSLTVPAENDPKRTNKRLKTSGPNPSWDVYKPGLQLQGTSHQQKVSPTRTCSWFTWRLFNSICLQ